MATVLRASSHVPLVWWPVPIGAVGALYFWKSDHRWLKVLVNAYNQNGPIVAILTFQTGGKIQFSRQQNCKTDELLQKQPAKKIHFIWDSVVGSHQSDGHFQRTMITSGCYVFFAFPHIKLKIRCWSNVWITCCQVYRIMIA